MTYLDQVREGHDWGVLCFIRSSELSFLVVVPVNSHPRASLLCEQHREQTGRRRRGPRPGPRKRRRRQQLQLVPPPTSQLGSRASNQLCPREQLKGREKDEYLQ